MLWDVDPVRLLALLGQGILVLMAGGFVWLTGRRWRRVRWRRRLARERRRLERVVTAAVRAGGAHEFQRLVYPVGSLSWKAVERVLLNLRYKGRDDEQDSVTRLFERLSYVLFYSERLRHGTPGQRRLAARRLGMMGSRQAVDVLVAALDDPDSSVREEVVGALIELRDPRVVKAIVRRFGKAEPFRGVRLDPAWIALILNHPEAAVPALVGRMGEHCDLIRLQAAEALRNIPDKNTIMVWTRLLSDGQPEVRARAAEALGRLGHPLAVQPLLSVLGDPFWYVRLKAVRALGAIRSERAIWGLWLRLMDARAGVRAAAADALYEIGTPAVQAMTILLRYSPDRYARERVASTLERAGLVDRWIQDLAGGDAEQVQWVRTLLKSIAGTGQSRILLKRLQKYTENVLNQQLLEILSDAPDGGLIRLLDEMATGDPDPRMRLIARDLVLRIGRKRYGTASNADRNHP